MLYAEKVTLAADGAIFSMPLTVNVGNAPRFNILLDALPDEDYERLLPNLELVRLARGEILYGSGDEMNYLHFPINSIVSFGILI